MTITVHCVGSPNIETRVISRDTLLDSDTLSEIYVVECEILSWTVYDRSLLKKYVEELNMVFCRDPCGMYHIDGVYGALMFSKYGGATGVHFAILHKDRFILIEAIPVEKYYELCKSVDCKLIYVDFTLSECSVKELTAKAHDLPRDHFGIRN